MNRHSALLPLAVAMAALTGLAHAGSDGAERTVPAELPKIDFDTADKDGDGQVSREEAKTIAELEAAFDRLDADADHALSRAEFARWARAGQSAPVPRDPATAPGGSAGAQHVPDPGAD